MDLRARRCQPCRPGTPPLEPQRIAELLELLPGDWRVEDGRRLARSYRFDDFATALAFVNQVGEIAEREGHHPDVVLRWGEVRLEIWTHAAGGLTENDFVLAAKCEAVSRP